MWLCGLCSVVVSARTGFPSTLSPPFLLQSKLSKWAGGQKRARFKWTAKKSRFKKDWKNVQMQKERKKMGRDPVIGTFSASLCPFISICRSRLILAEEIGLFLTLPFKLSQYVHFQDQLIPALTYWPRKQVYIRQGGCCLTWKSRFQRQVGTRQGNLTRPAASHSTLF